MQDFGPVMVATHDVPREVKEAAVIERRRDLERARADRIFDVKNRTIGIDTAALEAQIAAKKRVEELESERERTLDAAMIATAKQADILQQEVDRMKAVQLRDIAEYRSRNQAKTTRREYDLSDPDALKKDEIPTVRLLRSRHRPVRAAHLRPLNLLSRLRCRRTPRSLVSRARSSSLAWTARTTSARSCRCRPWPPAASAVQEQLLLDTPCAVVNPQSHSLPHRFQLPGPADAGMVHRAGRREGHACDD